jgi:iron complex outermembrane receptor protein
MESRCCEKGRVRALALLAASWSALGAAQAPQPIETIVVTATRTEERAFDLPVAIDSIDAAQIQRNQLQINLSESLSRIPGIVVANRWNYAQDLQVSSRGFGARANFGVRGIRLYQDGIPATMPDGQGQTGSFSLASAQRIEVLRGPFSTLYGNASGGVISVFTEDGPDPPQAQGQIVGGSYGTYNAIAKASGIVGGAAFVVAANHFSTDGYRDHSEASRDLLNAKLKFDFDADTRVTLIGNSLYQPEAQDPLGLSRAQWQANPRQADPSADLFNTRKTVNQLQGGAAIERQLGADTVLRVTGYGGRRLVRQYLALAGTSPTSSGGVTDLDGDFSGVDARVTQRSNVGGGPLTLTAGVTYDRQHQFRRGFVNNNGELGEVRRDEDDFISATDGYAQAEWAPLAAFSFLAGAR